MLLSTFQFASFSSTRGVFSRTALKELRTVLNPPKRTPTTYALFFKDRFNHYKSFNLSLPELARKVAADWKSLSEFDRKSYTEKSVKTGEKARNELEHYRASLTPHQSIALKLVNAAHRYRNAEKLPVSFKITKEDNRFIKEFPKPPYPNGRAVFASGKLKGLGREVTSKIGEVSAEWKKLSEAQKHAFEQQAQQELRHYRDTLVNFLKH